MSDRLLPFPIRAQIFRAVSFASGLLIGTWAFFGPISAWHHITVFGLLGPVVLDGEGPHNPSRSRWEDQDIIVYTGRLTISAVLWVVFVLLLFGLHRKSRVHRT